MSHHPDPQYLAQLVEELDHQHNGIADAAADAIRALTEKDAETWNAAIEAAALRLHWMWNADGTKCERRVAEESAASIRLLKK